MVRIRGLEPPHLAVQAPQACASTNFATVALSLGRPASAFPCPRWRLEQGVSWWMWKDSNLLSLIGIATRLQRAYLSRECTSIEKSDGTKGDVELKWTHPSSSESNRELFICSEDNQRQAVLPLECTAILSGIEPESPDANVGRLAILADSAVHIPMVPKVGIEPTTAAMS